ncbi:MAG: hypothetical protein AB1544_13520 [Pseudomonadota bacterium]
MAVTRRKFFIKTRQRRRKQAPPGWSGDAPVVPAPPTDWVPPPAPSRRQRNFLTFGWLGSLKLLLVVVGLGYGIYFLVTSEAGRDVYATQKAQPSMDLPTYPGHRPSTGSARGAGVNVEYSLADRLPPTDQSFVDTFGGSRNSVRSRGGAGSGESGSAGASGELPEKFRLREDLAGNCDIGSNGSLDIANCLRRNSVPVK